METIKTTKYLRFDSYTVHGKKTKIVSVVNIHHNKEIGVIQWYSAWRQYCFFPGYNTIWNKECLGDINEVIYSLMEGRRLSLTKPKQKTIGVIVFNVENFNDWKALKKHKQDEGMRNTQRTYVHKNKRYVCLSRANDCCGYSFDEVTDTGKAAMNPEYGEIVKICRTSLIPGGKWMGKKIK